MNGISAALTLWQMGFTSNEEVIAWADSEITKSDIPSKELIDLSLDGPATCLKQAEYVFPSRPMMLNFQDEFWLRAAFIDLSSEEETYQFADWASRHCMGQDLSNETVKLGNHFDHLICDCNDRIAAIELAREMIPSLEPHYAAVANDMLKLVANLKLHRIRKYER